MRKYDNFIEDSSLQYNIQEFNDKEDNISPKNSINNLYIPLKSQINSDNLNLIFRNQLSNDITLSIDKSKILTISDLINLLLLKVKVSKSQSSIRLFFKGRPLKNDEKINDISN